MENLFGFLAFAYFCVLAIVEWKYKNADKRTRGGKFLRFIIHAIGTIMFIVVAAVYCFAQ